MDNQQRSRLNALRSAAHHLLRSIEEIEDIATDRSATLTQIMEANGDLHDRIDGMKGAINFQYSTIGGNKVLPTIV